MWQSPRLALRPAITHLLLPALVCALPSLALAEDRSIDGTGNQPGDFGAAGTELIRIGDTDYRGDGSGTTMIDDSMRANPREISNTMCASAAAIPNDRLLSALVWQWGQFVDHDIDLTESHPDNGTAPIAVPEGDLLAPGPIPFNRSNYNPATGTGTGNPREQINAITSFIDASQVYGSDPATADALRSFSGGRLLTQGANLLPIDGDGFFMAGDVRANEQVGLTTMHTLFMREHNRLADLIANLDPLASDEAIYQMARKIVGAQIQAVTYQEFLPALLGAYAPPAAAYSYDPNLDPSIANEFATAFYRFGHSMVSANLLLADENGNEMGTIALRDAFFDPTILMNDPAKVEEILRGLALQRAQEVDLILNEDLRSFLFGPPGAGGMDLAALNIQRGRDHGLPDYNSLREAYGLQRVASFDEITSDTESQMALADLYGNVDNIDPWVGGLAEEHLPGSSLGELATAALVDQFVRLRDGDRFFYLGDPALDNPIVESLINWETFSLRDVIVANAGAAAVLPADVFVTPEPSAPLAWLSVAVGLALRRRAIG